MAHKVLVVEDDPTVAEVVVEYLRHAGLEPHHVADGALALATFDQVRPDLVVLDVMLPGLDGLSVCRQLRERGQVPVVMLTALGEETDRIAGLELGADDYVTKPFSARELVLRIGSVLRRCQPDASTAETTPAAGQAPLTLGELRLDPRARRASRDNVELALTSREFDLLAFLMANADQAFSRAELLDRVWGWSFGDQSTVTVHVRRLREKIEPNPSLPQRLVTVWGVGYRLQTRPEPAATDSGE